MQLCDAAYKLKGKQMKKFLKKSLAVFTSIVTSGLLAVLPVSADELRNGDTNNDGIVNIYDAINICKHILKKPELTGDNLKQADYDKDGDIDIYDAIFIARLVLFEKKVNEFASLINKSRTQNGIKALETDHALTDASMKRAFELTQFRNVDLRPNNTKYTTIFPEYEIAFEESEKFAAYGASNPSKLYAELIKDSKRQKTLLSENYTRIGVGYCQNNDKYKYYWTIFLIK